MPGTAATPSGRSGKAVAALVLGIVGVIGCFVFVPAILAIVFGALALKQIKRTPGLGGRGMAIAGLVLGIVGFVAGAVVIGIGIANRDKTTDPQVGDCVKVPDSSGDIVFGLTTQPCDKPHQGEVFATGALDDTSADYPGTSDVQNLVGQRCADEFTRTFDEDLSASDYTLTFIYPSKQNWQADKRDYVCIVYDQTGDLGAGSIIPG